MLLWHPRTPWGLRNRIFSKKSGQKAPKTRLPLPLVSELRDISMNFVQNACKAVRWKALDPYFAFLHFASICEHFSSIYEHARKIHFLWKNRIFPNIFGILPSKMLAEAREMLVDAHKVQKCKIWVKRFQTHNLSCKLHENSLRYANLKNHNFSWFLHVFSKKIWILQKCKKCSQIEISIFQWIFVQIACKIVR